MIGDVRQEHRGPAPDGDGQDADVTTKGPATSDKGTHVDQVSDNSGPTPWDPLGVMPTVSTVIRSKWTYILGAGVVLLGVYAVYRAATSETGKTIVLRGAGALL